MSDYRWNAATRPAVPGDHVVGICKGGHDSTETPCEYQPITEADVLELVEAVAAAQAEARNWKRIAEDATHVEREELTRLRGLLGAARCPNCDGSGAIPHGPTPDGDWEAEQCQWCYEKQEALSAGGDQ